METSRENLAGHTGEAGTVPELLKEMLTMQRFVGENTTQALVEGDVALPGGLREEITVLSAEAMAVLEEADTDENEVEAEGKVTFHILYTQGDPTAVSSLEASAEFSQDVEIPGVKDGMIPLVSLTVEHVEATAQGGRMHLLAILKVHARVYTDEPFSVVTGMRAKEEQMLQTKTLPCLARAAKGDREVLIREECSLGAVLQIKETLYASAFATVQDVMGGEEKATVSGNILLEVTHRSDMPQRPVVVTRHTIPFEEALPLDGRQADSLCCNAVVKDVAVLSQEGQEDGEKTMRAEILLRLGAEATTTKDVCLLLDAYTTSGCMLHPKTMPVNRVVKHHQIHTAESGKLTLMTDGQPPVRTPLKAGIRPVVTDLSCDRGRLNVEGMMEVTLLYMTDDSDVPRSYKTEEPFRASFACDVCSPEALQLVPSSVDAACITSDRVEIKYILHLSCRDMVYEREELVSDVAAEEAPSPESGIILCFSRQGESVWDIAKHYRVSAESLKRMNPGLEEGKAGQKVILWRRGAGK